MTTATTTAPSRTCPSIDAIRSRFPAVGRGTVFLDNAGGSQLPADVIDAVREYMLTSFVQTGAEYAVSARATANVASARGVVRAFLNADSRGEVIFGPSSTALLYTLADAYADGRATGSVPSSRNEIVVCTAGHEANIGPWLRLARRGFTIREWQVERDGSGLFRPNLRTLESLLSDRTLLVAFPQVSNILGEIWDAAAVCSLARSVGARSMIDGVAYAPHHAPDVAALGCDWYVYSTYKVFGPHMGALFGSAAAFAELTGPNHVFIDRTNTPGKWEVGGANHEGCAAINALPAYARFLAGTPNAPATHGLFKAAFEAVGPAEAELEKMVLAYLASKEPRGVRVIGPSIGEGPRVSTISFVKDGASSAAIARHANAKGFGIKAGHFYSKRLCDAMGLTSEGVVRISPVHYNNAEELNELFRVLDAVL